MTAARDFDVDLDPDPDSITPAKTPPMSRSLLISQSVQARQRLLQELADEKDSLGHLPASLVKEVANLLDVHPDHVRRLVRALIDEGWVPRPHRKTKKTLPDEVAAKIVYFKWNGDAVATHTELIGKGLHGGMELRTFQRYIKQHWDAALRACARGGHREMVKQQFFNREHQPYRTYAYGTDHSKLPFRVLPGRGFKPVFPWLSVLMDLKTRLIICWIITLHDPVTEDTLALLAEGIRGREVEGRGFVGGLPEFLRTDRGGDYISNALALGLVRLDVSHQFTEAYSSHQNGRVERFHRTVDESFAPTQVGFHAGGEDEYTKRVRRATLPDSTLDVLTTVEHDFSQWVEERNNKPHSALGGLSPYDAWFSDPHPVKTADHTTIAHALLREKTLHLQKYGLDFARKVYSSPRLGRLMDRGVETVEVRYYARDDSKVEVFHLGEWVCTATESDKQSEHEKAGIAAHRRAQTQEASLYAAHATYQKALDREENLRRRGIPKDQWPTRPSNPEEEGTDADRAQSRPSEKPWAKPASADDLRFLLDPPSEAS